MSIPGKANPSRKSQRMVCIRCPCRAKRAGWTRLSRRIVRWVCEQRPRGWPRGCFVFACAAIPLLLASGCSSVTRKEAEALSRFAFNEPHMGTIFSITLYAPDADAATAAAEAAFRRVAKLDRMMTDYDTNSELMRLCLTPVGEPKRVSPELFEIFKESLRVAKETDGAFDITVGPMVRAWRAARKTHHLPTEAEIAEMRKAIGWRKVRLNAKNQTVTLLAPHMQLDLGGIAKGY